MKNPRIALIVDHPQRDLAGIVLTALDLCHRGATCYLVPHNLESREIWALAPDFVLLNFFRPGNDQLARRMAEAGIQFGLLDTEGGVLTSLDGYQDSLWADRALLKKASCVCMWGPKIAQYSISERLFEPAQVVVTGCPRFDYYHPRLSDVMRQTGKRPAKNGKLILLNTNFTVANPRFASPQAEADTLINHFGMDRGEVLRMQQVEARAVDAMADLANRLSRDFPDANVILRPHPFERRETYEEKLENPSGLEVNQSGAVQEWILQAAAVIQRGCSTAVEAGFAGVPALSPQWISVNYAMPAAETASIAVADYGELRDLLARILRDSYEIPQQKRAALQALIRDWFYEIDGLAHQRVSAAILASLCWQRRVHKKKCLRFLYGLSSSWAAELSEVGRYLRFKLRLSPDWSFWEWRSVKPSLPSRRRAKYFDVGEVERLVEAINRQVGGEAGKAVRASFARDGQHYIRRGLYGHAVVLESGADQEAGGPAV